MSLSTFRQRLAERSLTLDPAQSEAAARLGDLAQKLAVHVPRQSRSPLTRWFSPSSPAPRGLYLWGGVGRGKTMLMDLFFEEVAWAKKVRIHFHAFMQEVHARLAAARRSRSANDAIVEVAGALTEEAHLFCLDEVEIIDIADAMIVGRLFEALIARDAVIVATSNTAPHRLYENGLNRALFLPFIDLIEEHFDIVEIAGDLDYRLGRIKAYETFITPLGPEADAKLQALWTRLTDAPDAPATVLEVAGRTVRLNQAAKGAARGSFAQLCEAPLGASDYLALARRFRTLFLERIPRLSPQLVNPQRRFVTLIDTLYDSRTKLIATADAAPAQLFGESEGNEIARAISRLEEMQSASWWGGRIVET
jgi:cell division protein ZapE